VERSVLSCFDSRCRKIERSELVTAIGSVDLHCMFWVWTTALHPLLESRALGRPPRSDRLEGEISARNMTDGGARADS
jgi:hypothetical protein